MKLMVKDGNYVHVADAHIDSFIKQGYAVADGVPPTFKDKMAALEDENARLKAELEIYKEQVSRMLTPVDEAPAEPEAPAAEETPKAPKKAKK